MKTHIFSLAILFSLILLVSCTREPSSSVDQDKIYTKYELVYDANEDITTVKAEFRFGSVVGTKLELSQPASIRFNGELIPFNSTLAIYEEEIAGYVSSGTFTYNDVDGNIYSNTTPHLKTVEFPNGVIEINAGEDYVMLFNGNVIGSNDVVTLNISDKIFATSMIGVSSITLGGVQTSSITPGPYIGYLSRTVTESPANATPEGGLILLTYKANNKAIQVN